MTPAEVAQTARICSMLVAALTVAKEHKASKQLVLLSAAFVADPTETRYADLTGYMINLGYQCETVRLRGVARRAFAAIPDFQDDDPIQSNETFVVFKEKALKELN